MADAQYNPDMESENWDVDNEAISADVHDRMIRDLLKRNKELLTAQAEDEKELSKLMGRFDECAAVQSSGSTSTLQLSSPKHHHTGFELVCSDPKKLYVTNISYRTSQKKLWDFFANFGPVRYCQLLKNHNGRSKGRGFVTFTSTSTAELVLSLQEDDLFLDGRYLHLEPAKWKKFHLDDKEPKSESYVNSDSVCQIDILTDDALLKIFSYLTLKEVLLCQRVCKKWKDLCVKCLQLTKHLSFNFLRTKFISKFKQKHFDNLVQCVSPSVKSIDLSMMNTCLGGDAVITIAKYCPQLHCLNISGLFVANHVLQKLANSCCQLQVIKMNRCHRINDKGLWQLFRKCRELRELAIEENAFVSGKSFSVAGNQLQQLSLSRCVGLQDFALSHLLTRSKNLKAIDLGHCVRLTPSGIAHLSQLTGLEVINLSGSSVSVEMLRLEHLNQLKEIYLQCNRTVNEEFLSTIGMFCVELRVLDISATNVRLGNIKNLRNCRHLHTLKANNLTVNKIGNDLLADESKLKIIHLQGCNDLTLADITYIVTVAKCLEELDIRWTGLGLAAQELVTEIQLAEAEKKIKVLFDDGNADLLLFDSSDEDIDDADMDEAYNYLEGEDPLFDEQFQLS